MGSELMPRISDEALHSLRDTVACSVKGRGIYLEAELADDLASVLRELEERRAEVAEDARHAAIGALVERIADRLTLADTVRLYRTKNPDEYVIEQFGAEHECGVTEYGNSLLEALRALAAEVSGD